MTQHGEFPIREIHVEASKRHEEQLGSKEKFWFEDGAAGFTLFKRGRQNEDWSEKVGTELGKLLGVPCAEVELATWDGYPGIISRSFLWKRDVLIHGNELLHRLDSTYPGGGTYHVSQHTVDAAIDVLDTRGVIPWDGDDFSRPQWFAASDVFVGYLLLDAWIGNSDRHHENWAVVQRGEVLFLAPSYDHASSLGRNEPLAKVERRLLGRDRRSTVEAYASKCRSAFYESPDSSRPMSTRDAFFRVSALRPRAAEHWRERLHAITDESVRGILDRIPGERCTEQHKSFAHAILQWNRRDLLSLSPVDGSHG